MNYENDDAFAAGIDRSAFLSASLAWKYENEMMKSLNKQKKDGKSVHRVEIVEKSVLIMDGNEV